MSKIFTLPGWGSGEHRVLGASSVSPPPPPPPLSLRTAIGSWDLDSTLWGLQPTPDSSLSDSSGTNYVTATTGKIDKMTLAGGCFIARVTGGNQALKDSQGHFSPALWKAKFDSFVAQVTAVGGGVTKVRTAVASGVFRGIMVLDDFTGVSGPNAFTRKVTFEEMEDVCQYAKSIWPWMPLVARAPLDRLRTMAILNGVQRFYAYLDAAWAQNAPKLHGDPVTWFASQVADGIACGLATVGGCNMINQGVGTTPGWGCHPGTVAGACTMSPTEIRQSGFAALDNLAVCGYYFWAYNFLTSNWLDPAIQAAMQDVYNKSLGRTDGPMNIRGDLVAA